MNLEELEFLISQYADGTLDPEQAAALEVRLRGDAEARALLADHRRINTLLLDNTALPAVRFERLAEVISDNIDQSEQQHIEQASRAAFGRWIAGAAVVAACALIGLMVFRHDRAEPTAPVIARVVEISGPSAEVTSAPRVAMVSIDPPMNAAVLASIVWQDISPAGARIVVSAGEPPEVPDALSGQ